MRDAVGARSGSGARADALNSDERNASRRPYDDLATASTVRLASAIGIKA